MIFADEKFHECINSPVRRVEGRVELYQGSTLLDTFNSTDRLKSFSVERIGEENKFFGFGICQKLIVKLLDRDRTVNIDKTHTLEAVFGTECYYTYTNPLFYVYDVKRDEVSNDLTIEAYDGLYVASSYTFADLGLQPPYTVEVVAAAIAAKLNLPFEVADLPPAFQTNYEFGANFEGTENLRIVLDAIAEVTQTIYFINHEWKFVFKRLDIGGEPVLTIDKSKYFTLSSKAPQTLTALCHVTELGDNVLAGTTDGATQYIRNNPFWELRDDVAQLLTEGLEVVNGLTASEFDCSWRGNYLIEIGDKIELITKDNESIYSYLTNDTLTYDGALSEKTQWAFNTSETETATNPATLGEALKYTYARVDKVNKQIELVVSDITDTQERMSSLELNTDSIAASVRQVEQVTSEALEGVNQEIATLTNSVEAKMSPEDVSIIIKSELDNGVTKVTTNTGYKFDDEGLTVSKSGSEMTTTISEDGMTVYKNNNAMLVANNEGVDAVNLRATTYLIIGENSRFEDYGNRTGCFWTGG